MKIVKSSCSSKRKVRTCTFSPQVNIKNKRTAIQTEQDVNAAHSEAKIQDLIDDIRSNIYTKVKAVATSPDFGFDENEVDDYFFVEASSTEIGEDHHEAIRVEVRAEVSYEGLEDLMEALNPIIETYDSYAYFEPVEPGIIESYVSVNQVDMSVYGTGDVLAGAYKQDDSIIIDAEDLRGKSREEIEEILKDAPVGSEIIHVRNTSNRFNMDTIIEKQQHYSSNYHQGFSSPHDWKTLNEFWAVGGKEDPYIDKTIYEAVNGKNKYYGLTSDVLKAHGIDQPIDESTSVEASDSYDMNGDTYEYVDNVDGYWIYRAIVDGKGVWRAMPQGSDESQFDSLSFPISYDQARGFEPIDEPSAIRKLRKDLGKKLLSKAGQSVEAIGMEPGSSDIEMGICSDKGYLTSSTDDKVFIEDIIDGLEDTGYDLSRIRSIRRGLLELFGYKGKDADIIIHDLVAGGFIDPNDWVDKDYTPGIYSATKEEYKTSENYKGRRIRLLNDGTGYAIFEKGEMIDYGFKSLEDAEAAIDEYDDIYQDDVQVYSATEEDEEDLPMVDQEYDSAATSINSNKLPAIYKMVSFNEGDVVVDFGGGKFDNAVEYIRDKGATLCVYDPYNRSAEHNKEVLRILRENGGADAAVNSNVLNVIKEPEARKNVLENIARITKPGAPIYITVYEGKGNGQEGPTKSGYQLNRKTADYLEEIQEVFPDATRRGKLITAHNSGSVSSATDIQAANNKSYEKYLLNQVGSLLIDKLESEYDIEFFITDMYIDGDDMHIQVYGDDSLHGDVDIPVDYSGDVYDFADDAFNKLKDIFQNNSSNTVEGSQDISRYDKEIVSYRKIISKSVEDNDDFLTDYTMYEVVTEDGSVEYECYFGDNDLYGPWNGEGLDFEADNYDEAVEWYNSYSSDEIQSSESVEGSIAPEEFFTKDDLIEFAISVEDEINRRINPKKKFNVSDAYVEGNTVHIEVHNDAYELSGEAAIDMRRIRRPSDIHKYLPTVVDAMINEYNEVRTDEITSSTVLDSNTEFRENFEEAVDIFYEEYPATVELTDEQDEEYDTLYRAYVRDTGVLYSVKPGVVYIDINWDSSDILQALEETAEAIGIEHYPDPLDVDASKSVQGDAFSELEDAYLSPPEYDDPIEHEDSQELIEVELDQVITVDVDGDYEWDDDTYVWASPDGSNEEWRSEDGVYIDDKVGVVEHIDDLIIPNVPTRPGKYRVTGLAQLIYDVSGIQEYRTNYGPDDYESDIDTDHAVVAFNFSQSTVENLKITPVRR